MPRPPVLPVIDWSEVFAAGKDFAAWLASAENPEHAARMRAAASALPLVEEAVDYLQELTRDVHVVAFAEDWCGDVVRHVPVLERIAAACPRLHVRYLARSDRPDVFVRFLTNGGEAVPKFVFLTDAWVECDNWGPMTCPNRKLIARGKVAGDVPAARRVIAERYAADPDCSDVFSELLDIVAAAASDAL